MEMTDLNSIDFLPNGPNARGRKQVSMERIALSAAIAFGALALAPPCHATNAQAGKAFAVANCSRCHSIDKFTRSPLAIAPPFRTLHERYPVESLEEALGEGIVTGHPSMPEFRLDPGQVGDFISFLKSLEQ
jgi:cytochrome c